MKFDHITVCGSDLEKMRREFSSVGIPTQYGGQHANGLTHMALAGFDDGSYLELIAPLENVGLNAAKATGMMAGWVPLMTGNAGAGAWAVRAEGIQATCEKLRSRGIAVRGPERGGRARPDGARLEWETAVVGPGPAGSVLPFMIEDLTDRSLRVRTSPFALMVSGVGAVVIGVRDLNATASLFQQAYGWQPPSVEEHAGFGAKLAGFATAKPEGPGGNAEANVILAAPSGPASWLVKRIEEFGECPLAFLLRQNIATQKKDASQHVRNEIWFGRRVIWLGPSSPVSARIGLVSA
jgi:hypothetical protein